MATAGNLSFVSAIKEIEANYGSLSKVHRVRVEKWVEKLVTTGGTEAWLRNHRNAYARLLLSQVLARKLDEPFLTMPPLGSLPPFPRHLLHRLRGLMGTHEGSFWRELYSRMDLDQNNFEPPAVSVVVEQRGARGAPAASVPNDLAGMKMLIREQMNRIALLEQQLQQERLSHEQEIQELLLRSAAEEASAGPPALPLAPSIVVKRIVPKEARHLKIYDIAKPAVFTSHVAEGALHQEPTVAWMMRRQDDGFEVASSQAPSIAVSAAAQPTTGFTQEEASFLAYCSQYLEKFESEVHK